MAQGRIFGSNNNVNYLLQDYSTSIDYFQKVNHINNFLIDLYLII